MITIPTTLILGAGASADVDLPFGWEFRNRICQLHSDYLFMRQMTSRGLEADAREFLERFRYSQIYSPDRFLETYPEYTTVGRYAIAWVLANCESAESVFSTTKRAPPWYEVLIDVLDFGAPEYRENKLSILTFNYDRSLEYYLWGVIESRYRGDDKKMAELWFNKPEIVHLHGQIDAFEPRSDHGRQFQPIDNSSEQGAYEDIEIAADGVKIIHEVQADTDEFLAARYILENSRRVAFLGFGFDERNINRLEVFGEKRDDLQVFGTGAGFSYAQQQEIIENRLNGNACFAGAFKYSDIRTALERAQLDHQGSEVPDMAEFR